MLAEVWRGGVIERCSARRSENKDNECRLGVLGERLLRDAQVEVRRIRTRIAGWSIERGVIERSSFRVWSIRTRSADSAFGKG